MREAAQRHAVTLESLAEVRAFLQAYWKNPAANAWFLLSILHHPPPRLWELWDAATFAPSGPKDLWSGASVPRGVGRSGDGRAAAGAFHAPSASIADKDSGL